MRKVSVLSVLLSFLALAGNAAARGGMPTPTTGRGEVIEGIYFKIYVAGVITFLFVMALLVWVIVRYRASSGVGRATFEKERENLKMEMAWIVVPLGVVMWVGLISYGGLVELDEGIAAEDVFMELDIIGSQWNWEAQYPAGFSVFSSPDGNTGEVSDDNVFVVPAGQPILFNVTALEVIHSFAIQEYDADAGRLGTQVGMVDANPHGPHKYNHMVVTFEAGEYRVQCKEMCFNPGHGYMRARILAVPMLDYQEWTFEQTLPLGADFVQRATLTADASGVSSASGDLTVVDGGRLILTVEGGAADDLSIPGLAVEHRTSPRGVHYALAEVTGGAATYEATTGNGTTVGVQVIEAELVTVQLDDYVIIPSKWTLEGGKTYLVQVQNVGPSPHNLFVGDYDRFSGGDDAAAPWRSVNINGGQSATFLMSPEGDMGFQTWCNVPGHYGLGMKGTLTVS